MQRSPRAVGATAGQADAAPVAPVGAPTRSLTPSVETSVPCGDGGFSSNFRKKRARLGAPARPAVAPDALEHDSAADTCIAFEGEEGLDVSFPLKAVEKSFRCPLCDGYFRDAVTIKECLHTFCRWCLFRYVASSESEEVSCPFCERMVTMSNAHKDGAGKDSRQYLPRITAACVAAASNQAGQGGSSSGALAVTSGAVLFDRTMQNIVDKLFPDFGVQERLEEEELNKFLEAHAHRRLPEELLPPPAVSSGLLKQKRARFDFSVAANWPSPPPGPESAHSEAAAGQLPVSADAPQQKAHAAGATSNSCVLKPPVLDELVDQLLSVPTCCDEQETTAIALLPDWSQGNRMSSRIKQQLEEAPSHEELLLVAKLQLEGESGFKCLPVELPQIACPFLRVPSRMPVQLVIRYLASQLHAEASRPRAAADSSAVSAAAPQTAAVSMAGVDLENALELTLEGRVLGRSHTIDFVRKARRLHCAGRCLLLLYRYTAQMEAKVIMQHVCRAVDRQNSGAARQGEYCSHQ